MQWRLLLIHVCILVGTVGASSLPAYADEASDLADSGQSLCQLILSPGGAAAYRLLHPIESRFSYDAFKAAKSRYRELLASGVADDALTAQAKSREEKIALVEAALEQTGHDLYSLPDAESEVEAILRSVRTGQGTLTATQAKQILKQLYLKTQEYGLRGRSLRDRLKPKTDLITDDRIEKQFLEVRAAPDVIQVLQDLNLVRDSGTLERMRYDVARYNPWVRLAKNGFLTALTLHVGVPPPATVRIHAIDYAPIPKEVEQAVEVLLNQKSFTIYFM